MPIPEELKVKIQTPETFNEGILELDDLVTNMEKQIEDLTASNDRYKETNANLALKVATPETPPIPEIDEGEELENRVIKFVQEIGG